jgi:hypothetical protein
MPVSGLGLLIPPHPPGRRVSPMPTCAPAVRAIQ